MSNTQSIAGLAGSMNAFVAAYGQLLESVERALWSAGADGDVAAAQEDYAGAVAEIMAIPGVEASLSAASRRLADVMGGAVGAGSARETMAEATRQYLQTLNASLPALYGSAPDPESLTAIASGMTTLAWIYGAGAQSGLGALASTTPFSSPAYGTWPMSRNGSNGDPHAAGATSGWNGVPADHSNGVETAAPPDEDDDEIVWQEFSIGQDGEITQRSVPSAGAQQRTPSNDADGTSPTFGAAPTSGRSATAPPPAGGTGDPVADIERAIGTYRKALESMGLPHEPPFGAPVAPLGGPVLSPSLDQSSADVSAAYLRLVQGAGTLPELYASYARFIVTSTLLAERQLALVRTYEQLLMAGLAGQRPVDARRAADAHYQSFLASVRDTWSRVDPAALSPEQLAAMSASMAQAAEAHRAAMRLVGFSPGR